MSFKSSSFLYAAASSIMLQRSGQRGVVGGQFPTLVRFLTGSVDSTMKPADDTHPQKSHEVVDETSRHVGDGFVVRDCSHKGILTLIRQCEDEIIRIHVTPYPNVVDYYDDECWKYRFFDLLKVPENVRIDSLKQQNPDAVVDINPCLHLALNIWYGDMYRRHMMFDVLAFPDTPDKISIRRMVASYRRTKEDAFAQPWLEDFEDFLKVREIEPSRLKPFLEYFEKRR